MFLAEEALKILIDAIENDLYPDDWELTGDESRITMHGPNDAVFEFEFTDHGWAETIASEVQNAEAAGKARKEEQRKKIEAERAAIDITQLKQTLIQEGKKPARGLSRILGEICARGKVTVIASHGGMSKSTLAHTLAAGITIDRALIGPDVVEGCPCLFLGLEDDQDFNDRTAYAIRKANQIYGNPKHDLHVIGADMLSRIFHFNTGQGLQYLWNNGKDIAVDPIIRAKLSSLIQQTNAGVVIVDPIAVLYGGTQMTNEAMNLLIRDFAALAVELNIAIILISHARKPNSKGPITQHDVKHGGELVDASRCTIIIDKLSEKIKTQWENAVDSTEPRRELDSVRMATVMKTNMGQEGYRFYYTVFGQSVECADGKTETVGACKAWTPPDLIRVVDLTLWHFLRPRIEQEFIKAAPQAKPNLKTVIEDLSNGTHDVKAVIKAMEKAGWIAVELQRDPAANGRDRVKRIVIGPTPPEE
ncbi:MULTISPECIES: AAA family ATPase [unclassified Ruegeria]|uniref:AAA family ATPase n=1 Tax=unclassified Ruegeria TaxID=2625375 RepID=UPI00148985CD|nr:MULTISPECIES: AAA family ATPase [unclassified Ruegeria]